jgi:hypothetical protein
MDGIVLVEIVTRHTTSIGLQVKREKEKDLKLMFHLLWKAHYYNLYCWLILLLKCRYLGHCVGYMVVASILLGVVVVRHFAIVNPLVAKRAALEHNIIRLRKCFCKKGHGNSSSVLKR